MIWNSQFAIALPCCPKPANVFEQVFLFSGLRNHRFQQSRRVTEHPDPAIVIYVQIRGEADFLLVAGNDLVHKPLQKPLFASHGAERKRLQAARCPPLGLLCSRKPYPERSSFIPKAVTARRRY